MPSGQKCVSTTTLLQPLNHNVTMSIGILEALCQTHGISYAVFPVTKLALNFLQLCYTCCIFLFFVLSLFFLPGVRRTWMNVPPIHAWTEAFVSTTWTVLSVCVIWISQGYTAKSTSVTSTCTSSWACGRTSSSWRPTWWYALTMSQILSGYSMSMIRPLLVYYWSSSPNWTELGSSWRVGTNVTNLELKNGLE